MSSSHFISYSSDKRLQRQQELAGSLVSLSEVRWYRSGKKRSAETKRTIEKGPSSEVIVGRCICSAGYLVSISAAPGNRFKMSVKGLHCKRLMA